MAVSVAETEAKYDAPADLSLPALAGLPQVASTSGPEEQELSATYFDTSDLRLLQAGITLRRRTGGTDAGWHLKLPAGKNTRTEIRLPLGRAVRQVPRELAELVLARTRGRRLQPVAVVTTKRRITTLLDGAGQSLAEVADDEVSATRLGDAAAITIWREVEVELTGGNAALLTAADSVLQDGGLRPAGRSAKLEKVLPGSRTPAAGRPRLSASAPAYQPVVAYLAQQAETLATLDPLVRRGEPDALHQMRVATRRLRSALQTFGTVLSRSDTGDLASELRWLAGVLGAARDAEVQASRLERRVRQTDPEHLFGPVAERVQAYFADTAEQAQADVAAALTSTRYYALLDGIDAVVAEPPLGVDARSKASRILPAAVGHSYRRVRRRMRRAARSPSGVDRDLALHQARKAAKQARYAAEAAAVATGAPALRFAEQMRKVQTALGEHQDTVVGRQLARELAIEADEAGESAFSYGLIYEREASEGKRLQVRAAHAWKRASRRRDRSWMDVS